MRQRLGYVQGGSVPGRCGSTAETGDSNATRDRALNAGTTSKLLPEQRCPFALASGLQGMVLVLWTDCESASRSRPFNG